MAIDVISASPWAPVHDASFGSPWRQAVHEAGHGLAYVCHRGTVTKLELYDAPREDGAIASCRGELQGLIGAQRHLSMAVVRLAGIEAERVLLGEADEAGARFDRLLVAACFRQLKEAGLQGADAEVWHEALSRLTRDLIKRHTRVLTEVAEALFDAREVHGPECMALFARATRRWGLEESPLVHADWPAQVRQRWQAIKPIGSTNLLAWHGNGGR